MKIKSVLLILGILLGISSSCNKKCKFDKEDTISGDIVEDVIIYQTQNFNGERVVIREASPYSETFTVSFDGGLTRQAVDYDEYHLINFPTTTKCDAVFTREVKINDVDMTVKYNITFEDCDRCASELTIDNFVLVPAFPATYDVQYKLN